MHQDLPIPLESGSGSEENVTKGSRLSDQAVLQRLECYNRHGAMERRLRFQWEQARDVLEEAALAFWTEFMPRIEHEAEAVHGRRVANVVQPMLALLERKHTTPVDEAWIFDLTNVARDLYANGLQMPVYIVGMNRHIDLVNAGIRRKFSDQPEMREALCDAHRQTKVLELEILLAQVAWIDNDISIARRTEKSAAFHGAVQDVLEEGTRRSVILRQRLISTARAAQVTVGETIQVAEAAEQSATAMSEAARTAAGLISAIDEVRLDFERSNSFTVKAAEEARRTVSISRELAERAEEIVFIVTLIREIAGRTNLLALNATIEAARAGEAGRGFTVVAQEVKSLARQTAQATDDIAAKIAAIQASASAAVSANEAIRSGVAEVNLGAEHLRSAFAAQSDRVTAITAAIDETAVTAKSMADTISVIHEATEAVVIEIGGLTTDLAFVDHGLTSLEKSTQRFVDDVVAVSSVGLRAA